MLLLQQGGEVIVAFRTVEGLCCLFGSLAVGLAGRPVGCFFAGCLVGWFVRPCVRSFVRSFVILFVRACVRSFVRWAAGWSMHWSVDGLACSMIDWLVD